MNALRKCVHLAEKAAEIVRRHRRMVQRKAPLDDEFDLHALIGEVLLLLAADARADEVTLGTGFDGPECRVVADRIQIEQVVINLVRNAVEVLRDHAAPHRAVTVATRRTEGGVEIRVTDNGPGIAEAVRHRVFDPFFTTRDDGAGLGLSISRRIAEAHSGSLRLEESGPGCTTFVLELPQTHERHVSHRHPR